MEENHETPVRTRHVAKWEKITAVSTFALAVLGIGTLLFAWRQIDEMRDGTQRQIKEMHDEATGQINEMREEARGQHLTAMMDKYDSPAFQSVRKSLAQHRIVRLGKKKKRLRDLEAEDEDFPPEFDEELQFCDNIGLLTDRGYLDRHDVWYAFGQWLFFLREDARPYLDTVGPADYQKCISLVDSISAFEQNENKGAYLHPSEDDRIDFYQTDIDMQPGQPANRIRGPKKP